MPTMTVVTRRLAALFLAGLVLLLSPAVGALNGVAPILGVPASLLFLLVVWVALVGLAFLVVGRAER
ncbi:MAG: hypothetical protein P1P84_00490 [Deferrisomatales bacterium]|nr:hypothetical protein [Deferrisomatales bacterium]